MKKNSTRLKNIQTILYLGKQHSYLNKRKTIKCSQCSKDPGLFMCAEPLNISEKLFML